jgi:ribonuclease HI
MWQEFEKAICTDAACPSNPWPIEYRGVIVSSGEEIFNYGPYLWGSVNIAEFLAIVEGLQRLSWQNYYNILYTDSTIALWRILKGTLKTSIKPSHDNQELFNKIDEALVWLDNNPKRRHSIQLKKRPTSQRGQIPADFGRK